MLYLGYHCLLPPQWKYELTISTANSDPTLPSLQTDGTAIIDGRWITAKCQLETWTFMNKYRRLPNPDDKTKDKLPTAGDYLDSNEGRIMVTCQGGVMRPDIFTSETKWCARGCPNLDPNFLDGNHMDVDYPRGSLSLNSYTAPVVRDLALNIKLSCKIGYGVTRASYNRTTSTICSLTGYKPALQLPNYQECVKGCTDPTLILSNIKITTTSSAANPQGVYSAGESVSVECSGSNYTLVGPGFRKCREIGGELTEGLAGWDPPLTVVQCVQGRYAIKSGGLRVKVCTWELIAGLICSFAIFSF